MIITDEKQFLLENLKKILSEFCEDNEFLKKIKEEYYPLVKTFIDNLKEKAELNIFGEEEEKLTLELLVEISKRYIVKGANEVVVIKKQEPDAAILYLSYAKDRELLAKEDNKYVIIKAKELASEVRELFKESEIIILN